MKLMNFAMAAAFVALPFATGCGDVCDDAVDVCEDEFGVEADDEGEEAECEGANECGAQCIVDEDSCDVLGNAALAECIAGC